jgi:hypothetical protein
MTRSPLLRSPELRIVVAATVAAVSLGFALLEGIAVRTDLLMLDFREWQAVGPRPDSAAYFDTVQTVPPDVRPLKLDLRLAEPGSASDFLAVERSYEVDGDGCYRFRVYAWTATPVDTARAFISVNDEAAWSMPLNVVGKGRGVSLDGFRPRQGEVEVRLELRAEPRGALPAAGAPVPSVRFEYAVLRRIPCGSGERAGA